MKNKILVSILSVLLISVFSPNVFSQDTVVRIEPPSVTSLDVGDIFSADIIIENGQNVAGCQVWIDYDPSALLYVDDHFKEGDYFSLNAFYGERQLEKLSDAEVHLRFAVTSSPLQNSGDGIVATLSFKVLALKESSLILVSGDPDKGTGTLLSDVAGNLSSPDVKGAKITPARITLAKVPSAGATLYTDSALETEEAARCVAYSPDGTILAAGDNHNEIRLWDPSTGKLLHIFKDDNNNPKHGDVYSIAFSNDNVWLAIGGQEGKIRVWKRPINKTWAEAAKDKTFAEPEVIDVGRTVWSVAFSHDGTRLACGKSTNLHNKSDTIDVFELDSPSDLVWDDDKRHNTDKVTLSFHNANVKSIAFHSTNNDILASASDDKRVVTWSVSKAENLVYEERHSGNVNSVAFSPDGNYFASGSDDRTAILWELGNPEPLHTFTAHTAAVLSVVFNGNGTQLLSGSEDKRIGVGDVHTGIHQTLQRKHNAAISSIAYNLQRDAVATGSHDNTVWQQRATNLGNCITLPSDIISEVAFGPASTYFVFTPQYPMLIGVDVNNANVYYSNCNITLDLPDVRDELSNFEKYGVIPLALAASHLSLSPEILSFFLNKLGPGEVKQPSEYISELSLKIANGEIARYFMFELKTPGEKFKEALNNFQVGVIIAGFTELIGLVPGVGDAASAIITIGELLIEHSRELYNILKDTVDPAVSLKRPTLVHPTPSLRLPTIVPKYGLPEVQQRFVVILPKREKKIEIKMELEYSFQASYVRHKVTYAGPLDLENGTFAAPNARPMSLIDYPPFQQLPPEVQAYILQHFEGYANHKAINAEAWQVPETTSLLPNYPNPFNPETWIPYQLSEPAEVKLTIYDINGRVVRDLDLGHQRAGIYQSRARAAHWDGRNTQGEPVASGLYFYTLKAGEFSATRKMLIRK